MVCVSVTNIRGNGCVSPLWLCDTDRPQIDIISSTPNPLELPLTPSAISDLKAIAISSSLGISTKTVHDEKLRKSLELDATQFTLSQFDASSVSNACLERIRQSLCPDVDRIVCEPYKLLIYAEGGFFKAHVDTPRSSRQFGSLIISLPTTQRYEGGAFSLCFGDKQVWWTPSHRKCEFIAFYSDVQHEIRRVRAHHRVVLTFNLSVPSDLKDARFEHAMADQKHSHRSSRYGSVSKYFLSMPKQREPAPQILSSSLFDAISTSDLGRRIPGAVVDAIVSFANDSAIVSSIQKLLDDEAFHAKDHDNGVLVILSHRYHGRHIDPMSLKGRDLFLFRTFRKYFGVYVMPISIASVIGKWSDEEATGENDYYGGIIDEWDEKSEKTTWKVNLSHSIPEILRKRLAWGARFVVLYSDKQQTLKDAQYVNGGEENYGNCGTYDLENQYKCTALVLTRYVQSDADQLCFDQKRTQQLKSKYSLYRLYMSVDRSLVILVISGVLMAVLYALYQKWAN